MSDLILTHLIRPRTQPANSLVSSHRRKVFANIEANINRIDLLLSAAPIESHVGAIVVRFVPNSRHRILLILPVCPVQDSPNACVTMGLPLGIFEYVRLSTSDFYGTEFLTLA